MKARVESGAGCLLKGLRRDSVSAPGVQDRLVTVVEWATNVSLLKIEMLWGILGIDGEDEFPLRRRRRCLQAEESLVSSPIRQIPAYFAICGFVTDQRSNEGARVIGGEHFYHAFYITDEEHLDRCLPLQMTKAGVKPAIHLLRLLSEDFIQPEPKLVQSLQPLLVLWPRRRLAGSPSKDAPPGCTNRLADRLVCEIEPLVSPGDYRFGLFTSQIASSRMH